MICAPSPRQCDAQVGVLVAVDGAVEAPAVGRVVAEVRIDAERQVGEVAQPREHPGHVVGRQAVDEQRPDPDLLEVVDGAAELVALGPAPVLAEHAADAVPAAAEADPDGDPALHERLDGAERQPVADERHRLEQDEVGRVLVEHARQQLEHLLARLAVDVAVDAEGERRVAGAAGLLDRLAPDAQAAPGDVHPVHRGRERGAGAAVELAASAPTCSSRSRRCRRRGRRGGRRGPRRAGGPAPRCPRGPRPRAASRRGAGARAPWRCRRRASRSAAGRAAPRSVRTPSSSPARPRPPCRPSWGRAYPPHTPRAQGLPAPTGGVRAGNAARRPPRGATTAAGSATSPRPGWRRGACGGCS